MPPSPILYTPDSGSFIRAYRPGGAMRCPDCGQSQWLVGRVMAECACCEGALPLDLGYRGWLDKVSTTQRAPALPL